MSANVNQAAELDRPTNPSAEAREVTPDASESTVEQLVSSSSEVETESERNRDSSRWSPLRARLSEWGLRRTIYWHIMNFLGKCGFRIHRVGVGAGRFDLFNTEPPEIPPGYETRPLDKSDLEPFVGKLETELSQEFLDTAFANGDDCVGSFFGDQLVAFAFVSRTRTTVTDQIDVIIPEGFKYDYKSWTHRDHRRRNISKMIGHVMWKALERDYSERVIWYIETHNYQSLLHSYTHPRQWSLRFGYVGWFTLFGRQIPFNSRWAKKIGFEFVRKEDDGKRYYGG